MKITKALIEKEKSSNNYSFFEKVLSPSSPLDEIKLTLNKLGRLPDDFDTTLFIRLFEHSDSEIRLLAVKNLGKIADIEHLKKMKELIENEDDSMVIRETYSSIGRIKKEEIIPILVDGLSNPDPKIVLQCIRGLLRFKQKKEIWEKLNDLREHENEIISDFINVELIDKSDYDYKKKKEIRIKEIENILVCGDAREVLRLVPDESIHLTFTSPPYYNARDYSIFKSYEMYLDFLVEIFTEVHRITKEGRFFVLNTSPVIIPRISRKHSSKRYLIPYDIHPKIIDIGFEFIDDIIWKKPGPSAVNRNAGFAVNRKPLTYKTNPITESVIVYRKESNKLIDWNLKQYDDNIVEKSKVEDDFEETNVWEIAPASNSAHPAIFPKELASNIIKLYSMTGDIVHDPFAGIGTVGLSALELKRKYFLVEKDEKYCEEANRKLKSDIFTDTNFLTYEEFEREIKGKY